MYREVFRLQMHVRLCSMWLSLCLEEEYGATFFSYVTVPLFSIQFKKKKKAPQVQLIVETCTTLQKNALSVCQHVAKC